MRILETDTGPVEVEDAETLQALIDAAPPGSTVDLDERAFLLDRVVDTRGRRLRDGTLLRAKGGGLVVDGEVLGESSIQSAVQAEIDGEGH